MEVICGKCESKLNIPDEKIPKGQLVTASCPKCKNKLTLDTRSSPKKEGLAPTVNEKAEPPDLGTDAGSTEDEEGAIEFYEEGTKLALVMINGTEQVEKTVQAAEALGYKVVSVENTREAINKMRLYHFDLAIVSDGFDGIGLKQSPITHYMNHLSMSIRRRIFIVLIGDTFSTMDHMMAFAMSANMVINPKDFGTLADILKSAIGDNERFYKVFMDTLTEFGKA